MKPGLFLACAFAVLWPRPAKAAADVETVEGLVARARTLGLANEAQWLRLGHWRRTLLGGWKSEADGMDFFLSKEGVRDPSAELEATLRGIFGVTSRSPDQIKRKVQPAYCRFPARTAWLVSKLAFDPAKLAIEECPKLTEYWKNLDPISVTLVFSSYYLNNPASMFGHTFLRIRKRGELVSSDQRELLDHGVDFSAQADTSNPLFYAFKGLTGFFPGTFNVYPYFYKVREYNDYESRDLWEYELILTPQQIAMLVAHLWELGSTWFDYYYIDENCSYHILGALEAAAPELKLLDRVRIPVVPADTVKALHANPGLVKSVHYRPSATTQFRARVAGLSGDELAAVDALSVDASAALPQTFNQRQRIEVLDAAADLIDVRYAKELPFQPDGAGGRLKQKLLERRAAIAEKSDELVIAPPSDKMPDRGHGSSRIAAAGGYSQFNGQTYELSYRLALHALDDPPEGYPELAQIEFFATQLRFAPRGREVWLERLQVVDVLSLHQMDRFDQRLSWRARAGAIRLYDGGCTGCLAGSVAIGSGATFSFFGDALTVFAMADGSLEGSPSLTGIRWARALRLGVGPYGGVRLRLANALVWMTAANWYWLPASSTTSTWSVESSLRLELTRAIALGASARRTVANEEALFAAFLYF